MAGLVRGKGSTLSGEAGKRRAGADKSGGLNGAVRGGVNTAMAETSAEREAPWGSDGGSPRGERDGNGTCSFPLFFLER